LPHVGTDLRVGSRTALPDPPEHLLTFDDLRPEAASSKSVT
jgi:hypothetical protein